MVDFKFLIANMREESDVHEFTRTMFAIHRSNNAELSRKFPMDMRIAIFGEDIQLIKAMQMILDFDGTFTQKLCFITNTETNDKPIPCFLQYNATLLAKKKIPLEFKVTTLANICNNIIRRMSYFSHDIVIVGTNKPMLAYGVTLGMSKPFYLNPGSDSLVPFANRFPK